MLNLGRFKTARGLSLGDNIIVEVYLPRMLVERPKMMEVMSEGTELGTMYTLSSNFMLNNFFGFSMNMLWGAINSIQLMVKLPLLRKIYFPASAQSFVKPLTIIASFDILNEYDIIGEMFYYPDFNLVDLGLTGFEEVGLDSWYFTQNLGTLFLIILVYIVGIILAGALLLVKISGFLDKIKQKLVNTLFWNSVLRLLIEAYFDILLGLGITYTVMTSKESKQPIPGVMFLPGVLISNIFAGFFLLVCICLPFFIIIFYLCSTNKWQEKDWQQKWGSVLDGLDKESESNSKSYSKKWMLFFPVFMLVRRVAFVISVFSLSEMLVFQLIVLLGSAIINSVYLLALWPHTSRRDSLLEVVNEFTNLVLLYHLMCFSDLVPQY